MVMPAARKDGGSSRNNRRMFDKVTRDGNATFNTEEDGPTFFRAMQEFRDEPVDLLFRLVKPQVSSAPQQL